MGTSFLVRTPGTVGMLVPRRFGFVGFEPYEEIRAPTDEIVSPQNKPLQKIGTCGRNAQLEIVSNLIDSLGRAEVTRLPPKSFQSIDI